MEHEAILTNLMEYLLKQNFIRKFIDEHSRFKSLAHVWPSKMSLAYLTKICKICIEMVTFYKARSFFFVYIAASHIFKGALQ